MCLPEPYRKRWTLTTRTHGYKQLGQGSENSRNSTALTKQRGMGYKVPLVIDKKKINKVIRNQLSLVSDP